MGTTIHSAPTSKVSWDPVPDVGRFVAAIRIQMSIDDGAAPKTRVVPPKKPLSGHLLDTAIEAMWTVAYSGMQWRVAAKLFKVPRTTLTTKFKALSKSGVWDRALESLAEEWRIACGDAPSPSVMVADSRTIHASATSHGSGFSGEKRHLGFKLSALVDKHGSPFAVDVAAGNRHDSMAIRPLLEAVASEGFSGAVIGDLAYKGAPLKAFCRELGIRLEALAGGRGGIFVPDGIRWVVERTFAWLSRYRRLNSMFERKVESHLAFVKIALIGILARRLCRVEMA